MTTSDADPIFLTVEEVLGLHDDQMPADVGGAIYAHLDKAADVSSIEGRLSDFITRNL